MNKSYFMDSNERMIDEMQPMDEIHDLNVMRDENDMHNRNDGHDISHSSHTNVNHANHMNDTYHVNEDFVHGAPFALVIDNGTFNIKIGSRMNSEPKIYHNFLFHEEHPNQIIRLMHGDKISQVRSTSNLHFHFPLDETNHLDPELQTKIWDYIFHREEYDPRSYDLLCTKMHMLGDMNYSKLWSEIIFETFEFRSSWMVTDAYAAMRGYFDAQQQAFERECRGSDTVHLGKGDQRRNMSPDSSNVKVESTAKPKLSQAQSLHTNLLKEGGSACIVDCGFRSTRIIPILHHQIQYHAIKEFNIGGKLFTNELQRLLTKRHFDFTKEWWIANHIKEKVLTCSLNYANDIFHASQPNSRLKLFYQLPHSDMEEPNSDINNVGFVKSTPTAPTNRSQYSSNFHSQKTGRHSKIDSHHFHEKDKFVHNMNKANIKTNNETNIKTSNTGKNNRNEKPNDHKTGKLHDVDKHTTWEKLVSAHSLLELNSERIVVPEYYFQTNMLTKYRMAMSSNEWRKYMHPMEGTFVWNDQFQFNQNQICLWNSSPFTLASGIIDSICGQGFSHQDQQNLLNTIILCGGTANIEGLQERLQYEISKLCDIDIIFPRVVNKSTLAWHGAVSMDHEILSDLRVTRSAYQEMGSTILYRMGFAPIY